VVFPGGFGTLDELFELVTLQQTGKAPQSPIVLYDEAYWRKLINFDLLVEEGMIRSEDLELITFAESAEDAWSALVDRGLRDHAPPHHHR
jgi:predicted Rossmann-fold nucleotide-binding protein